MTFCHRRIDENKMIHTIKHTTKNYPYCHFLSRNVFTLTFIPPLPLAAQIVMKKGYAVFTTFVIIRLRRRYTTKHGGVSRRLLFSA